MAFTKLIRELRIALEALERLDLKGKEIEFEQGRASLVTTAFRGALGVVELLPADRDLVVRTFLELLGAPEPGPVVRGELG